MSGRTLAPKESSDGAAEDGTSIEFEHHGDPEDHYRIQDNPAAALKARGIIDNTWTPTQQNNEEPTAGRQAPSLLCCGWSEPVR